MKDLELRMKQYLGYIKDNKSEAAKAILMHISSLVIAFTVLSLFIQSVGHDVNPLALAIQTITAHFFVRFLISATDNIGYKSKSKSKSKKKNKSINPTQYTQFSIDEEERIRINIAKRAFVMGQEAAEKEVGDIMNMLESDNKV